jgi:hypothetical protein
MVADLRHPLGEIEARPAIGNAGAKFALCHDDGKRAIAPPANLRSTFLAQGERWKAAADPLEEVDQQSVVRVGLVVQEPVDHDTVGLACLRGAVADIRGDPPSGERARSSAGEHYVDIVGVTGSIPVAPTIFPTIKSLQSSLLCPRLRLGGNVHTRLEHISIN